MVPAYQRKPVLAYSVSIAFTFPYLNQTASEFCQVRLLLCQTHLNQPFAHFMAIIYRLLHQTLLALHSFPIHVI
jgi:hypothetical protein